MRNLTAQHIYFLISKLKSANNNSICILPFSVVSDVGGKEVDEDVVSVTAKDENSVFNFIQVIQ